jgi:hypothetical protein
MGDRERRIQEATARAVHFLVRQYTQKYRRLPKAEMDEALEAERRLSEALGAPVGKIEKAKTFFLNEQHELPRTKKSTLPLTERMLDMIEEAEPRGVTCEDLEDALSAHHQSVSARLRDLLMQGRILDSGNTRETRSGRKARVYIGRT